MKVVQRRKLFEAAETAAGGGGGAQGSKGGADGKTDGSGGYKVIGARLGHGGNPRMGKR